MRLYWEVARRGFRRYSTYVGATVGGLFTNSLFGFFRSYTFIALFAAAGESIGGFDLKDTLTYSFLTQSMIMAIGIWGWWEISESIRSGNVVTDLFRPYDYQLWWLAQDMGRALYHLLSRGLVPFLIGALAFELRVPERPITWILMALSVALAVVVSFGIRFLTNLLAFWFLDHRGTALSLNIAWTFLSGFIVPIAFFPEWARPLVEVLPFAATVQIPIEVFLEKRQGWQLVSALSLQLFWAGVLLVIGRLVLALATRRVVTQGG